MSKNELDSIFDFAEEIDNEKKIFRNSYISGAERHENDAEHAWHAAIMALLLSDYASEKIDVNKTVTMLLIHDIVEIDAGDVLAYDEEARAAQHEKELLAADRIFGLLPKEKGEHLKNLWLEFEEFKTPEAKFAHLIDNIQPMLQNHINNGKAWRDHGIHLSQIEKYNTVTSTSSEELWNYIMDNIVMPNVEKGNIKDDRK